MIDLFLEPFFPGVLCQGVDGKTCLLRLFLPSILTRNNDRLGLPKPSQQNAMPKLFKGGGWTTSNTQIIFSIGKKWIREV